MTADAAGDEAPRSRLDRLRALRRLRGSDSFVMHAQAERPTRADRPTSSSPSACAPAGRGRVAAALARREGRADRGRHRVLLTVIFAFDGDLSGLADDVEDVRHIEILSLGHALEIIKDLGDAETVADRVRARRLRAAPTRSATSGWRPSPTSTSPTRTPTGPTRSPTSPSSTTASSPTTTSGAGGSSGAGHRFQSECDSEIIAVYLAEQDEPTGCRSRRRCAHSLDELDGVFTYICVTEDALGMAKDELAAKPLVLYEGDDLVALASEEIAIRQVARRARSRPATPTRAR